MLTLEETIEAILKNQSEFDRKAILAMIDEKRQELGPEVVNEESAAMIVARELGIDLHQVSPKARMRIEDITGESRSVNLTAKVVNIGTVRTFSRKDGGEGKVASVVVADETGRIRVALWDEMTAAVSEDAISVGNVIQIRGAYVKKGLRDAFELNLGRMGGIKVLEDHEIEDLEIDVSEAEVVKISELAEKMFDVTLVAKIERVFNLSTFTRKSDGSEGKVLSMIVADETGRTRLVFWDKQAEDMQNAKDGEVIKITGAYTKPGRDEGIEVHGGRSSKIERSLKQKIDAVAGSTTVPSEPLGSKNVSELTSDMRNVDIEGKVARIFPTTKFERSGKEGQVQNLIVADATGSVRVTFWNEDVDKIADLVEGDVLRIQHGYVKEGFRGGVEFHVGRLAEIDINPKGSELAQLDLSDVSLQTPSRAGRVMIGDIAEQSEGKNVEICGIVVGVTQRSPVYPSCPNCRKKVTVDDNGQQTCSVCGKVEKPEYRMLYKVTLDDGSGSIKVTLFGKAGEDLLQLTADEAQKIIDDTGNEIAPIEQNSDNMLGRYVAVQGRVNKYRDSLDVGASSLMFVDPVEEIKRMKETIGELLS
ncbi:MAG: OB-fold nucleic acid binding domain-containing protein [Candidatus Thorarchaeota archaeon]